MPYEWQPVRQDADSPTACLHLWPHRSLPRRGFVTFVAITAALMLLPVVMHLGQPVLWGLLPFALVTLWGLWIAINRSYRDGQLIEVLTIWPDRVTLDRHDPRGDSQSWEANPYWTEVHLYPEDGPVPHYLTLRGAGREVELGAFMSEEERMALAPELRRVLIGGR